VRFLDWLEESVWLIADIVLVSGGVIFVVVNAAWCVIQLWGGK
jgi:hypothetical protein